MCGCGSDGKCHNCNSNDFIGYISSMSLTNTSGPFGTNGMNCTFDYQVNFFDINTFILRNIHKINIL